MKDRELGLIYKLGVVWDIGFQILATLGYVAALWRHDVANSIFWGLFEVVLLIGLFKKYGSDNRTVVIEPKKMVVNVVKGKKK